MLMVKSARGRYRAAHPQEIMEAAAVYLRASYAGTTLETPQASKEFVRQHSGAFEREVFGAIWLDSRHRVIAVDDLFHGTIDGASVYPREVVKAAIAHNAAAVILFHNHPSGVCEPSRADELITRRLKEALDLLDIRVLDHMIATRTQVTSFAERGLL